MEKENIFTFAVSLGSYRRFVNEVFSLAKRKSSSYVCFANVHMTVEAFEDGNFNAVLKDADIVAPDGKPLALFLKQFKRINQERVCGMDLFLISERAAHEASRFICTVQLMGDWKDICKPPKGVPSLISAVLRAAVPAASAERITNSTNE